MEKDKKGKSGENDKNVKQMYGRVDSSVTGERGWGFKNTQKTFEPDLDDEALKKLNPFVSRRTIREDTPLHNETANQE